MKSGLLFILLTLATYGEAQNAWPHENSEWWMDITYYLFTPALAHHYVSGDTLLDDVYCTVLKTEFSYAFPNDPDNWQTYSIREEYLHFNGDTLFWWKNDRFYPLICFNADVGDSWYPLPLPAPPDLNNECDSLPVLVTSTDSVQYNGTWYRRVYIQSENEMETPFVWSGAFDERTLWRDELYPEYNDCGGVIEYPLYGFRCYSDSELFIQEVDQACNAPLSVSDSGERSKWNIYPNPLPSGTELRVGHFDRLEILDLNGRILLTYGPEAESIIPFLPSGIYIARSVYRDRLRLTKFVVE